MNGMARFVPKFILGTAFLFLMPLTQAIGQESKPGARAEAASVVGKWTTRVHASSLSFDLKLEGEEVTGTFSTDQSGPLPLTGTFVNGRLSFTVAARSGEIGFTGRLKDQTPLPEICRHRPATWPAQPRGSNRNSSSARLFFGSKQRGRG